MYPRYVAAVSIACMICAAHLVVYQAFLPAAQTTDAVTTELHQSTDDDAMDASHTPTSFNDHAFDWAVSHDTGCDVITGTDPDDANHSVGNCQVHNFN